MRSVSLAFRNLSRQKKRSFLLGGAVAFGFFVVTLIDSLTAGLLVNMSNQFAYMFGGHILVGGTYKNADGTKEDIIKDVDYIDNILEQSGIDYKYICRRSAAGGTLSFEGLKATMNVFGCDLSKETFLPETMTLVEGSFDNMMNTPNGIIIGEATAKALKVETGDTVLFQTETSTGQATFCELTVAGISKDSSLMGSISCYTNMSFLNELLCIAPEDFYMYNIMLNDQSKQDAYAQILEDTIRNSGKPVTSRAQAIAESPTNISGAINNQIKNAEWEDTLYQVTSLNDQIPGMKQIINVMQGISMGILAVLFLVVMIGISNTFRMIIYERIREIGTMRAVGMHRNKVGRVFIWEAVLIAVLGAVIGLIVAIIAMSILGLFYFSSPELSMFLNNGHWSYVLSPMAIILKFLLIGVLTVLAMLSSARTASKLNPAEALRTTK